MADYKFVRCSMKSTKVCFYCLTGLALLICLIATYSNTRFIAGHENLFWSESLATMEKPHFVLGMLTPHMNKVQREAQRNTWISSVLRMQKDLPFKITYKFLIDQPTNETIKENKLYKDILFLNVTHHGRAVKFGEKLYVWFKYIHKNYPDALLGAKIDDDAFLCVPQIFHRLDSFKSTKLYYGWAHGNGRKVNTGTRCDEMFVVLGRELIERIAKRTYCGQARCNLKEHLIDTNYGGTSLGAWLSLYDDIDFHPDNAQIIHFGRGGEARHAKYVTKDFCEKRLIFHKSSPDVMKQLSDFNKLTTGCKTTTSFIGAVTGSMFSGDVVRQLPTRKNLPRSNAVARSDKMINCDNWAVVTTIFSPSDAVYHIANMSNWCLAIVADTTTPPKHIYLKEIAHERVKYITVEEQNLLYPLLSKAIPFRHFGRKNIGYMYAIQHKAKVIWDFDDDNIGVVDLNDLKSTKYVTACKDFNNVVVNPYPYFGVHDTRTWPRGFPLQSIKDNTTVPKICNAEKNLKIGVIQSLANKQPDVDAIYRLTREVPFAFHAKRETHRMLVVSRNTYAPFNAQATLWMQPAFAYMALPISVNGRVSDIWRSYIAQHFMYKSDIRLAFSVPYVLQNRNEHTIIRDFNAELDLYEKSKQLVDFVSSSNSSNIENIVDMYERLYKRKYLEESDLQFIDAWQETLKNITV